ncbi:MAG TPA: DUF5313 family protein [Mycobacteriales bacterium]|nr:DUF5313 family protein [Mycobacteriales bacterium]
MPGDPSLVGKLRFALGFRLPDENREWVRHELTDAGWWARMLLRQLVVVTPVAVLLALLPGPGYLHVLLPLLVILGALFLVATYSFELRAARLRQHGLPVPVDEDLGRPTDE